MATQTALLPFLILISLLSASSVALQPSSCSNFVFPHNQAFQTCTDLTKLNSFLHWSYNPSSSTLQIAFRHTQVTSSTWVAWGINPTSRGMVGTQAIVAYQRPDGTMAVFTSPIGSYGTQLNEGNLTFPVSDLSATFSNNEIFIYATLQISENSSGSLDHIWQDGPVSGNDLGMHELSGGHLLSMGTLNLTSGQAVASRGGNSKARDKIIHGVLNAIGWGIMMPLGFMAARYLKAVGPKADPLWFYIHVCLQLLGYGIGMAGVGIGFRLGAKSSGAVHHPCHFGIGITLATLGTLQVFAGFLRPAKDHKHRNIWNWFHHLTGYTILLLSSANIWVGFTILNPPVGWMIAYGVFVGALVSSSVVLEVWRRKTRDGKIVGGQEQIDTYASSSTENIV